MRSQGNTAVLAAVYGPVDVAVRSELPDRAFLEVILKPASKMAGVFEKAKEVVIREAVEAVVLTHMHPRSSITVIIQVIADDGAVSLIYRCSDLHLHALWSR